MVEPAVGQRPRLFLAVALLIYLASFSLPAFGTSQDSDFWNGFACFRAALESREFWPTWSANVVFWIGWLLTASGREHAGGTLGLAAVGLGTYHIVWMFDGYDLSGLTSLLPGFWLWIGSMGLLGWFGIRDGRRNMKLSRYPPLDLS